MFLIQRGLNINFSTIFDNIQVTKIWRGMSELWINGRCAHFAAML